LEYKTLGDTGILVSRLCFGSLTIGPMQANLPLIEGAGIIAKAISMGVNFIDTAKLYNTYDYIREAIKISGKENVVISSRSYDYTYSGMKESIDEALSGLNVSSIDIFGLHEQESIYTLRGHSDAIRYLVEAKKRGLIKAISISTHNIAGVYGACSLPEIDIIHPLFNCEGIGIGDGTVNEMAAAIQKAKRSGKGIYSMKPIGGGNLIGQVEKALSFVIDNTYVDSIAVGMQSENEIIANISVFEGKKIPSNISNKLRSTKRKLHIDSWCEGCGNCVAKCTLNALKIVNGKCEVADGTCRLCGYCAAVCPQFCIKIV